MTALFSYDNLVHAFAGSFANATAMTVFYPLDTIRSRIQLEQSNLKSTKTIGVLTQIVSEEGIQALYLGLRPVIYSLFTSGFVYFYSFNALRKTREHKTAISDLSFGAIAGIINVLTTTPLWVVNTRIKMQTTKKTIQQSKQQINKETMQVHYNGLIDGLRKIYSAEGIEALWAGTIPSLMLVSNPAIQFMIFELLKRNLKTTLDSNKQLSSYHVFALGSVSKLVSTLLTYPLQLIQSQKRYGKDDRVKGKSTLELMSQIIETEGCSGLYKGMEAKLAQTILTTSLMFVFYEKIYNFVTKAGKSIR